LIPHDGAVGGGIISDSVAGVPLLALFSFSSVAVAEEEDPDRRETVRRTATVGRSPLPLLSLLLMRGIGFGATNGCFN